MAADTLIFKRRNGKSIIKVIPSMMNGRGHENCYMQVNMQNYRDVALFLQDLRGIWNVPVDKAIDEYKRMKSDNAWPF